MHRGGTTIRSFWLAFLLLFSCKGPDAYAHLRMEVSLKDFTADQLALVRKITFRSQPVGNEDPTHVYELSFARTKTDTTVDYTQEYLPSPQTGSFVVQATVIGGDNLQLGMKSKTVELEKGSIVVANLEFASPTTAQTTTDVVMEGQPVEITPGMGGGNSFAFLWDTDHYLAIVTDLSRGNGDLVSLKLDPLGMPMSIPIAINSSPRVSMLPSVVKFHGGYLVAWQEGGNDGEPIALQIVALDHDGAPLGHIRQIPTTAAEGRPFLEAVYGTVAMTWSDDHGTPASPHHVAMVGLLDPTDLSFANGGPIDLDQSGNLGGGEDAFPALAVVGGQLEVSWVHAGQSVYSATVSSTLALSTPVELYTSEFTAQQLSVTSAGSGLFTAWEDLSGDVDVGRERIRGIYWSPDPSSPNNGLGAGGIVHKLDTGSANWPRLAWGTEGSVAVVYYQYREFGSQIYLTRYTPEGVSVGDTDLQLKNVAGEAKFPDIRLGFSDASGDHYAVGWVDDHTGVQRVYFQPIVCN